MLRTLAITVVLTATAIAADDPKDFIVHEWGTFSTFSGSDGLGLKFAPNDTDLPSFVLNRRQYIKGGVSESLVSLETPVLYFYTDRDRTVSVHVDFAKGVMTDWYPAASRPPTAELRWDNFTVRAKDDSKLPESRGPSRYFAAREVDAAVVETADRNPQREKFLFYRGVGDFEMPFEVKALGSGKFQVKNTGKHDVPGHFLVSIVDKKVTFKTLGKLAAQSEEFVDLPAEPSSIDKLHDAMVGLLKDQGLYEKEAKAMVKTWAADWFGEEGTRVLYLVAEPVTAELLPLKIEPKPDKLVRVLVGRHDLLTPEREKTVDVLVQQLTGDSNSQAKAADAELNKLGRYRSAAQSAAEKRLKSASQ